MASIRKRGSVWHVQIRRKDHPSLTKSFQIRSDAERWARRIERDIDLGDFKTNHEPNEYHHLQDLLERYRDTVSVRKRGHDAEKWRLNALIRHWLGKCKINELCPALLSKYRDERLNIVSGASVLIELTLIRHCLQIAMDEWSVPLKCNPASNVRLPSPSKPRVRRLETGELDRLLDGCTLGRTPLLAPVIMFAIETGMRRGEIVSAMWVDIDLGMSTLHIPVTKNGHARTIPLTPKGVELLTDLPRTDDKVFPITGNALRLAWVRLKKRVGIVDLRFHDLRHEAVSRFFEIGLSVPEVALISGHRDPRMLFRYTHLRAEDVVKKLL